MRLIELLARLERTAKAAERERATLVIEVAVANQGDARRVPTLPDRPASPLPERRASRQSEPVHLVAASTEPGP